MSQCSIPLLQKLSLFMPTCIYSRWSFENVGKLVPPQEQTLGHHPQMSNELAMRRHIHILCGATRFFYTAHVLTEYTLLFLVKNSVNCAAFVDILFNVSLLCDRNLYSYNVNGISSSHPNEKESHVC